MSMTCDMCLQARHIRCLNRLDCGCTQCSARRSKPQLKETKRERKPAAAKLPRKRAPRAERPRSDSEKARYMREYRRKVAENDPNRRTYRSYPPEMVDEMIAERDSGSSIRAIGRKWEVDPSYVTRLIRKREGAR